MQAALDAKQDVISDLSTIRSGAEAGSTAVQPNSLSTVATSGNYNDLIDKLVFDYPGDIIKDNSNLISTVYGGNLITFIDGYDPSDDNPGFNFGHKMSLSLPELT